MPQNSSVIYLSEDVHEQEKSNPAKTHKHKEGSKWFESVSNIFTSVYFGDNAGKWVFLSGKAALFFDGFWHEEFTASPAG